MKRILGVLVLTAMLLVSLVLPITGAAQAEADATGTYLILFEDTYVPVGFAAEVAALGGVVDFSHPVGIAIVSGLTEGAAAELGGLSGVNDVMANGSAPLDPILAEGALAAVEAVPESSTDPTTAYFYPRQWNMRAIDADLAWAEGRLGSPEVTVAILDTGIDYTYPDLLGRVDLSRSISFVPEDDVLVDLYFPGRHHITDLWWHGTHVAATVASNASVAAGVTSQTTLMGVKVCSVALGYCPDDAIVQGILYAVDNGADVINMSLGGAFAKRDDHIVGMINRLYNYANQMGVTVVVSAGNEALDLDHDVDSYKTYCSTPNTICVSATGPMSAASVNGPWYDVDAPAYYTNYGSSAINVAAPGGNSGGWVWAACSQTSLVVPICQTGYYVLGAGGTSMAAPHVSGLAALVVEDVGRKPGRVKTIIQKGADDLGKPGVDPFYGKGRINVSETIR